MKECSALAYQKERGERLTKIDHLRRVVRQHIIDIISTVTILRKLDVNGTSV